MAPAPVQAAQSTAQSTAQRVTRWADENRAVALALGLAAVGGVGGAYYFYTRNTSSSRQGPGGPEIEAGKDGEKSGKKKKSKKGKKSGTATPKDSSEGGLPKDPNGPLLDEASDGEWCLLNFVLP